MDYETEESWKDVPPEIRRGMRRAAENIIFWETLARKAGGFKTFVVAVGLLVSYLTGFLDFVLGAYLEWRGK